MVVKASAFVVFYFCTSCVDCVRCDILIHGVRCTGVFC